MFSGAIAQPRSADEQRHRVLSGRAQAQRHIPMARRYEWDALADKDGHDMDIEFIDLAGVEKRGDQLSATHHPECFPCVARRRCANSFTGSDTNSTPDAARLRGFRENT